LTAHHIWAINWDVISSFSFPGLLSANQKPEKSNMADFFPFSTNQQQGTKSVLGGAHGTTSAASIAAN